MRNFFSILDVAIRASTLAQAGNYRKALELMRTI